MIEQAFSALAWNISLLPFLVEYMAPVAFSASCILVDHDVQSTYPWSACSSLAMIGVRPSSGHPANSVLAAQVLLANRTLGRPQSARSDPIERAYEDRDEKIVGNG
ncbi:hypothetical protein ABIA06_003397 [Bradyrhizobium yuanmingense]|uniref:hypothetical protein n=1 Tax=Bradyrhizobium yuanmingense TaxID=108015 RepID=UPI0035198B60